MAQNQRSVSAGGESVSQNIILQPKAALGFKDPDDERIPNCYRDDLLVKWWQSGLSTTYNELVLRERIRILEDMGGPEWGLLGDLRAELMSIILSK